MRRFVTGILLLTLAFLVGPSAGAAMAACTPSAKVTAFDDLTYAGTEARVYSGIQWAQSFAVSSSITLDRVSLYLSNDPPTTDSITVEIRSDAAGSPGALLATRTRTYPSTTSAFADFDFSADNLSLARGTIYYVVDKNASDVDQGYEWLMADSPPAGAGYASGNAFLSENSGTSWTSQPNRDFIFQVWGRTCTADSQPGGGQSPLAAVSGLAFSNTTFAAQGSGPPATNARKKKTPRGTKVSFQLNEAASVRFTVKRRLRGRKVRRGKKTRCVRPTRKNRKRRRCTRLVTLKGSFSRTGVAGKNSFHFSGRLRGRKLRPGRYRLVATPTAAGNKGKPTSKAFRVVR